MTTFHLIYLSVALLSQCKYFWSCHLFCCGNKNQVKLFVTYKTIFVYLITRQSPFKRVHKLLFMVDKKFYFNFLEGLIIKFLEIQSNFVCRHRAQEVLYEEINFTKTYLLANFIISISTIKVAFKPRSSLIVSSIICSFNLLSNQNYVVWIWVKFLSFKI